MKPGDLVKIRKFEDITYIGIYLGPSKRFDEIKQPYQGRFILSTGIIHDIDLGNRLVWNFEVIGEKR